MDVDNLKPALVVVVVVVVVDRFQIAAGEEETYQDRVSLKKSWPSLLG